MDHPAHWLKCSLKISAVAALLMCVFTSHVSCRPHGNPFKSTISLVQGKIKESLQEIARTGHLSTNSCSSLNETELAGLDEQPLSAQNLSLFRCHMMKASAVIPELEDNLLEMGQHCETLAAEMPGYVSHSDCSLPPFEQVKDSFEFGQCLLKLLDQVLSKATRFI